MSSGIYTITNLVNNKIYVGFTTNFIDRKSDHFVKLRKNIHANIHLQRAFNKNGEQNFLFEILEECDVEFLCSNENYWCNLLNTHSDKYGYNISQTSPFGKTTNSPETRKRISNTLQNKIKKDGGHWLTPKHHKAIAEANRGRKNTSSTLEKMSKSAFKRINTYIPTSEHKLKISNSLFGKCSDLKMKHMKVLAKEKFKSVKMIETNGDTIIFNSVNECADFINKTLEIKLNIKGLATRVSNVLAGKKNNYKGIRFEYL